MAKLKRFSPKLVRQLWADVRARHMAAALSTFIRFKEPIRRLSPGDPNGPILILLSAYLLDRDTSHQALVEGLIARFVTPQILAAEDRLDSVRLDLAEGISKFYGSQFPNAIELLELARINADRIRDRDLRIAARYYLARAYYKSGKYDVGCKLTVEASKLAEQLVSRL
jgi:hypothetical protein